MTKTKFFGALALIVLSMSAYATMLTTGIGVRISLAAVCTVSGLLGQPVVNDGAGGCLSYIFGNITADTGAGTINYNAVAYTGTTAGSANVQTVASPSPSGFALTDQNKLAVKIGAALTNTGAVTLNINSTGALAVAKQTSLGLSALVGGELIAGAEVDFAYQASCPAPISADCYVITNVIPGGIHYAATSATITAAQWANFDTFVVTAASQTLTLPATTALAPQGGIVIQTAPGITATIAPNGTDTINGVNASLVIPAGMTTVASTSGSGAVTIPTGPSIPLALTYAPGINPNNLPIANLSTTRVITGIRCTPEVAAGGSATISVVKAASGTAISGGTALHSGSCNANATGGTDQDLTLTNTVLSAGDRLGVTATGTTIWTSSGIAAGVITVFVR